MKFPVFERSAPLALVLLGAALMTGCSRGAGSQATVKQEIIAREQASFDAWKREDKAF